MHWKSLEIIYMKNKSSQFFELRIPHDGTPRKDILTESESEKRGDGERLMW